MTLENGATNEGVNDASVKVETAEQSNGGNDANVQADELAKKEIAGLNKKIAELQKAEQKLKEIEEQRKAEALASKTAEEKMQHYEAELSAFKRERALNEALSGTGISVQQANTILNEKDATAQGKALAELVASMAGKTAENAVNEFKSKTLETVAKEKPTTSAEVKDAFTAGWEKAF